jgi:hypothetical protein
MIMKRLQLTILTLCVSFPLLAEAGHGLVSFEAYYPVRAAVVRRPVAKAIGTSEEWKRFWAEIESHSSAGDDNTSAISDAPGPDFSRYTVLVVALGTRPSGGYSVAFHSVRESESQIDAIVYELRPRGKNCTVTAAISFPVAFALIARTDKPVHFNIERADIACEE